MRVYRLSVLFDLWFVQSSRTCALVFTWRRWDGHTLAVQASVMQASGRGSGRGVRAEGRSRTHRAKRSRLVFKTQASADAKPNADAHPNEHPPPVKDPSSPAGVDGFRRFDVQQWRRAREQRLQQGAEEQRWASSPQLSLGRRSLPSKSAGYRRGRVTESTVRRATLGTVLMCVV